MYQRSKTLRILAIVSLSLFLLTSLPLSAMAERPYAKKLKTVDTQMSRLYRDLDLIMVVTKNLQSEYKKFNKMNKTFGKLRKAAGKNLSEKKGEKLDSKILDFLRDLEKLSKDIGDEVNRLEGKPAAVNNATGSLELAIERARKAI